MVVLANLPRIFTPQDKRRHRFRQAATAASILVAVVLTAGFAMICFMGVESGIGAAML
jgi:hypothetical protein